MDKEQIESVKQSKRHEELLSALKTIAATIKQSEKQDDSKVISAIDSLTTSVNTMCSHMMKPDDDTKVISAINQMTSSISKSIEELKLTILATQTKKSFEFKIERGYDNYIKKVIVN